MLKHLRKLLENKPEGSGWDLKVKPLIKMECRVWREKEQRWEPGPPIVESDEVIIS